MPVLLPAAMGMSIAGPILGGISAQKAANDNAKLQEQQGGIALAEANANAENEAFNQTQKVGNQRIAFLANGVSLEGSPSAVLKSSKAYGQSQVNSILRQGTAQYNLAQANAQITKNQGRAALIAGIAKSSENAVNDATMIAKGAV